MAGRPGPVCRGHRGVHEPLGLHPQLSLGEAEARFPAFLDQVLAEDPRRGEYFLPSVVTQLLEEKRARVKVRSTDKWYGVTYRE